MVSVGIACPVARRSRKVTPAAISRNVSPSWFALRTSAFAARQSAANRMAVAVSAVMGCCRVNIGSAIS